MDNEINFQCPICLFPLIQPITLTCGHNFCQPCVRNTFFQMSHQSCPLCRTIITQPPKTFKVNTLLEAIIHQRFYMDNEYNARLHEFQELKKRAKKGKLKRFIYFLGQILRRAGVFLQRLVPLYMIVILVVLVYLVKHAIYSHRLKNFESRLTGELAKIIQILKKQTQDTDQFNKDKYIDIQDQVFSKLVKYLFTSFVRF